ncbi:suppressor of SWI4 1 homolog [Polypterus senegalus]
MSKSKTKNQKRARIKSLHDAQESYSTVPHSFVFNRGQVGKNVSQLVEDMRRAMEPFTAKSLKVRKKNVLKDFVTVAGPLGVTHFLMFSKTTSNVNFRLARLPRGPMLYFNVQQYSLIKDVVSALKRHRMHDQQFTHHPLLILNNFGMQGMHIKLMATMFQNLFPSINVHKVSLNAIKRCILVNYDPETELIDFRHYSLKVVPVGMSKGMKKLIQERFPNMSKLEDISELLMTGANLSESEAELDGEHNITELPQVYAGRGNMKSQQSAVRLTEIGPRMTLKLVKIEEGLGDGKVLYHSTVQKTEEEIQEMLARKEKQMKLKAERRKLQEKNVAMKKEQREEHKKKSLEGIKKKQKQLMGEEGDSDAENPGASEEQAAAAISDEDEAEYYRQEVGEEPEEDMFPTHSKRKIKGQKSPHPLKKRKLSETRKAKPTRADFPKGKRPKRDKEPNFKKSKKAERRADRPGAPLKGKKGKFKPSFKRKTPFSGKPGGSKPFKCKNKK